MSWEFSCLDLDWKKKKLVKVPGSAKASASTGCGTPGIWITSKDALIPEEDFCNIIEYFLTNYDLQKSDLRLKLLARLRKAKKVVGYNGRGTRRLSIPGLFE